MICSNVGGIRDKVKQDLVLEFCRSQNKDVYILTETHINQDQMHQIRNNWLGTIFYSPGDTFTKGILVLLHPGFDHVSDIDTESKGRFVSFKVAPSDDRVFCIYAPSGHNNRQQLARGCFFEGLQTYIENKTQENEKKIIMGDFNCTLDKVDRDEGNKTHKRYVIPLLPCLDLSWKMGWRTYGGGRIQIHLSSPATIDLMAHNPGLTGLTLI